MCIEKFEWFIFLFLMLPIYILAILWCSIAFGNKDSQQYFFDNGKSSWNYRQPWIGTEKVRSPPVENNIKVNFVFQDVIMQSTLNSLFSEKRNHKILYCRDVNNLSIYSYLAMRYLFSKLIFRRINSHVFKITSYICQLLPSPWIKAKGCSLAKWTNWHRYSEKIL